MTGDAADFLLSSQPFGLIVDPLHPLAFAVGDIGCLILIFSPESET